MADQILHGELMVKTGWHLYETRSSLCSSSQQHAHSCIVTCKKFKQFVSNAWPLWPQHQLNLCDKNALSGSRTGMMTYRHGCWTRQDLGLTSLINRPSSISNVNNMYSRRNINESSSKRFALRRSNWVTRRRRMTNHRSMQRRRSSACQWIGVGVGNE